MTDSTNPPDPTPGEFALPESFQGNEAFNGIDSLDALAGGYADLHQRHAELTANQPVVPEDADGYEIAAPEGQELDQEMISGFKGCLHKIGCTNEQGQEISNWFNSFMGQMVVNQQNDVQKGVDGLKSEWGADFDAKAEVANKGLNRFFKEAKIEAEDQKKFTDEFGNSPVAIKLFQAIGSMISESPAFNSDGSPTNSTTPTRTDGQPMLHDYDNPQG